MRHRAFSDQIFLNQTSVLLVYLLEFSPLVLQLPGSGQYHSQLIQRIGHLIYLNVVFCLLRHDLSMSEIIRSPSVFMSDEVWECCVLDRFLEVAKFITLTPLSLLASCRLSLPIIGLKMSSLSAILLAKFSYGTWGIDQIPVIVLRKRYPLYHHIYLQLGYAHSIKWYHTNDRSGLYTAPDNQLDFQLSN
jgi:hypothetical protein